MYVHVHTHNLGSNTVAMGGWGQKLTSVVSSQVKESSYKTCED